jgi:CRISPR/Cas system endoribonuclease Cas6 (RAMP superfamily)
MDLALLTRPDCLHSLERNQGIIWKYITDLNLQLCKRLKNHKQSKHFYFCLLCLHI